MEHEEERRENKFRIYCKVFKRHGWYGVDYRDPEGRRIKVKVGSKPEAEDRMAQIRGSLARGTYDDLTTLNPSLEKAMAEYLEKVSKITKSPKSYIGDRQKSNFFLAEFGDFRVRDITTKMIEDYKAKREREVKGSSVNRDLALLKHFYNTMISWGWAKENPVKGIKFFKESLGPPRYLSGEEMGRLLDACERHQGRNKVTPYLKAIILVALNTGLRLSNLLSLRWDWVDMGERTITVPRTKNGEFHVVPISDTLLPMLRGLLRQRLQGAEYLFALPGEMPQVGVRRAFEKAKRDAGIDPGFRFHDLRHTFASQLVMNGVDLPTVKELMGHKDIKMTLRYAHLSQEHKMDAVNRLGKNLEPVGNQHSEEKPERSVSI